MEKVFDMIMGGLFILTVLIMGWVGLGAIILGLGICGK